MKKLLIISILTLIITLIQSTFISAQTNEVGTLPGALSVSPSGAATYTIPIDLPAGRAGMTPEIAFVYNNQAPSTILGQGWGISGFSSISRANPTLYYNGVVDNIDFTDDQLVLDGNRLIKVGFEGDNTIYRTEIDEISKVIYIPDGGYNNKEYFIIYTKDGLRKEYGKTNSSRQTYSDNNAKPLFWHLNKLYDQQGNSVEYTYEKSVSNGELHPKFIEYTLFNSGNGDESSYIVEFNYEQHTNPLMYQTFYFEDKNGNAFLNKNLQKLMQVRIKSTEDDEIIQEYNLEYKTEMPLAGEYCLASITLSAIDDEGKTMKSFNPTTFEWSYFNPERTVSNNNYGFTGGCFFTPYHYKMGRLDMTGNGIDEIIEYREEFTSSITDPVKKIMLQNVI